MRNSTVVVTGGCGFLGSHLVETLLERGHRVVAVDDFSSGYRPNKEYLEKLPAAKTHLTIVTADVTRPWREWLPSGLPKGDTPWVLHFASPASPPHFARLALEIMAVNSRGLEQALGVAQELGSRLVFASTSEVYGDPEVSPQPESYRGSVNTWGPRACYDESKRYGEALVYSYNLKHGTRHGVVRIFNTYGPRMNPRDGRVVTELLTNAIKGQALPVLGDGKQTRSFCYVQDLVAGILRYAESNETDPTNIGNDGEFTINALADLVKKLFPQKKLEVRYTPASKDDPRQRRPDLSRARKILGWEPSIKLDDGLKRTLAWLETLPPQDL